MFRSLKLSLIVLVISFGALICAKEKKSFEGNWALMQDEYRAMSFNYDVCNFDAFCHGRWIKNKVQIKKLIEGGPNKRFLRHSVLTATMVRTGFKTAQKFEETYLQKCVSKKVKEKIKTFEDVNTSWLSHGSKNFRCSINTLGHLYYAAKIFEKMGDSNIMMMYGVDDDFSDDDGIDFSGGFMFSGGGGEKKRKSRVSNGKGKEDFLKSKRFPFV